MRATPVKFLIAGERSLVEFVQIVRDTLLDRRVDEDLEGLALFRSTRAACGV